MSKYEWLFILLLAESILATGILYGFCRLFVQIEDRISLNIHFEQTGRIMELLSIVVLVVCLAFVGYSTLMCVDILFPKSELLGV